LSAAFPAALSRQICNATLLTPWSSPACTMMGTTPRAPMVVSVSGARITTSGDRSGTTVNASASGTSVGSVACPSRAVISAIQLHRLS